MTITELTKKHGIYAEDENKNHAAVNIEFVNIYRQRRSTAEYIKICPDERRDQTAGRCISRIVSGAQCKTDICNLRVCGGISRHRSGINCIRILRFRKGGF